MIGLCAKQVPALNHDDPLDTERDYGHFLARFGLESLRRAGFDCRLDGVQRQAPYGVVDVHRKAVEKVANLGAVLPVTDLGVGPAIGKSGDDDLSVEGRRPESPIGQLPEGQFHASVLVLYFGTRSFLLKTGFAESGVDGSNKARIDHRVDHGGRDNVLEIQNLG